MAKLTLTKKDDVVFTSSPDTYTGYANIARTMLTPEEAIFSFGLRDPEDPAKAVTLATIYMSLPHLKRLSASLPQLIAQHESIFGEIPADADARLTEYGKKYLANAQKKEEKIEETK